MRIAAENKPRRPTPPTTPSLGPWLIRTPPGDTRRVRIRGGAVLAVGAALLGVGLWLQPAPSGVGTHEQLGWPACSWWGNYGVPCPTCGVTTAFSLGVRGRWWTSFKTQPVGALAAALVMLAFLAAAAELVTGIGWRVNWYRVRPARAGWVVAAVVVVAWAYKVLVSRLQMR